jgi:hypothetical protein
MATHVQPTRLSSNIRRMLAGLRWRIRAYVFLEGLLLAIVWLAITFIAEISIDYGLVAVGSNELPWIVRFVALGVISGVLVYILWRWILRRTFVRLADHSMAVLLERRFIDFHDSLVTAVEMAEHPDHAEQFDLDMLAHTTDEAKSEVGRVRLSRVFNLFPLLLSGVLALALALPIGLAAFLFPSEMLLGFNRVYLLSNEPWPRRTNLEVAGINVIHASTRTGEVRTQHLKFRDNLVRVAKGANVELQVVAHGGRYEKPEVVEMYYWTSDEGSSRARLTRIVSGAGKDENDLHIYSDKPLHGVLSTIEFYVRGADYHTQQYKIEVVESPVIVTPVEMYCVFPGYMVDEALSIGLPRTMQVAPGASVPMGTELVVRAKASKPLKDARVVDAQSREELRPTIYRRVPLLDKLAGKTIPVTIALPPIRHQVEHDQPGAAVPRQETVAVSFDEPVAVFNRANGERVSLAAVDKRYYLVDPTTKQKTPLDAPLPVHVQVPALGDDPEKNLVEGLLQPEVEHRPQIEIPVAALNNDLILDIHLLDDDDVPSHDPFKLFVSATPDAAPKVDTRLRGISTVVTPNVRIPVVGEVLDDYGVARAWFDVERNTTALLTEDVTVGDGGKIDAALDFQAMREHEGAGRIELVPEDTLVVSIKAEDRFDLADHPNVGNGDRYQLKVVTEDQLLAYLARQEQTMREILEHAREEMEREHDALIRSKAPDALGSALTPEPGDPTGSEPGDATAAEAGESPASAEPGDTAPADDRPPEVRVRERRVLRVQQALLQSSKSRQEVRGVAEGFASIREELINNRVDAKDHMERLDVHVYKPLVYITDEMFPELDRLLRDLEEKVDQPDPFVEAAPEAIAQTEKILIEIDKVLTNLERFEGYNELVELLRGIINEQQGLIDDTKSEQTRSVLKELEGLEN